MIYQPGVYTFKAHGDDLFRIKIDGVYFLDGNHGDSYFQGKSKIINLSAGKHDFFVNFLEYSGGQAIDIYYKGPDTGGIFMHFPSFESTNES